jgi:GNAT superfamily N-acetyltransferase
MICERAERIAALWTKRTYVSTRFISLCQRPIASTHCLAKCHTWSYPVLDGFSVSPVTSKNWDHFEALFEGRGGPKSCWCMIWRAYEIGPGLTDKLARKASMKDRISSNSPVGLIGYLEGVPIAWCSIAPRSTFKATLGGLVDHDDDELSIWSLTCFFVKRDLRGSGISAQLIDAAIDYARVQGANIVEAYPVEPNSPSYRFSGFIALFEQYGFKKVGTIGTRRNVFRKKLQACA